jgi:hypothetical protein
MCSSETSGDFQRTTQRYIPEESTLHNHRCENLKSYILSPFSFGNFSASHVKRVRQGILHRKILRFPQLHIPDIIMGRRLTSITPHLGGLEGFYFCMVNMLGHNSSSTGHQLVNSERCSKYRVHVTQWLRRKGLQLPAVQCTGTGTWGNRKKSLRIAISVYYLSFYLPTSSPLFPVRTS